MYEPVLIGEYTRGLQTNRPPFMINKEAWATCENMWNFRGRMRKKYGYSLKGRLKITWPDFFIEVSPGGNRNYNLKTLLTIPASGTIVPGTVIFSDGTTTWTDNGLGTFTGGTGTINYNTGVVSLVGTAAANVFVTASYFPNLSVMGLRTRERQNVNDEQTIAFNTKNSFRFIGGMWECLPNTFTITNITTGGVAPNPEVTTATNHGLTTGDIVTISGVTGDATMQAEVNNKSFVVTVTSTTKFTLTGYTTTGTYTGGGSVVSCETWNGSDSQFFWTTNFENPGTTKQFWTTNYDGTNFTDNIKHYDGTKWSVLRPALNVAGDRFLETAKIIEPYKERLLVFYTVEEDPVAGDIVFPQRIRWSQIGNILDTTTGWQDDIEGKGGFLDIPTAESITTVGFIRDRIIIYCDRSTWELLYTGDELDPFKLRKINTELGAESTFSRVLFDNSVLAIGNVGIHTCNGDSVIRIDEEIPSFVFDFHNHNQGIDRVYGIRDYYNEIVMWSYPNSKNNPTYPNRMLIYNYRDNNWSIWKDSFTCYGYFQRIDDRTWASYDSTKWEEANFSWQSGQGQARYREIIAGNQNGYVFTFFPETTEVSASRYITNITQTGDQVTVTVPDHNFEEGDYIKITGALDTNGNIYDPLNGIKQIANIPTGGNTIIITGINTTLPAYQSLGEVTKFDNIDMRTKFFTPYWKSGSSMQLNHIDFDFERTRKGELVYNIYIDDNDAISMSDPTINIGILGDNTVRTRPEQDEPLGFTKGSTWHRSFVYTNGQTIQVQLTMNDTQMKDENINQSDIVLYAFILYVQRINDLV